MDSSKRMDKQNLPSTSTPNESGFPTQSLTIPYNPQRLEYDLAPAQVVTTVLFRVRTDE
jgi:hypothetical protein